MLNGECSGVLKLAYLNEDIFEFEFLELIPASEFHYRPAHYKTILYPVHRRRRNIAVYIRP